MAASKVQRLVREFAHNVAAQTAAIARGDHKTGNKHARRYIQAFMALRELGDAGRDALAPLMHEGRDDVREMAAAYLLRHRHEEARLVLEQLARGDGLVAFAAGQALQRWNEGTWQLDPP